MGWWPLLYFFFVSYLNLLPFFKLSPLSFCYWVLDFPFFIYFEYKNFDRYKCCELFSSTLWFSKNFNIFNAHFNRTFRNAMKSIVCKCQRLLITNIIQHPINCNVLVHNHLESCFISASFKGWMYPRQLVSAYITDGNSRGYSGHCFICFHVKPKCPRDMAGSTPNTERFMQIKVISQLVLPYGTYENRCYPLHKTSVEMRFTAWMFWDWLFLKPKIAWWESRWGI